MGRIEKKMKTNREKCIVKLKWFLGGNEELKPKCWSTPMLTPFGMLSLTMSASPISSPILLAGKIDD